LKEITFLKQNYQKWQQFEDLLNSNLGQNPDALADLFIRITDDLSWAHTFYPGSNTEKYLNDLAARIHQEIYKNKKEKSSRLITFWTQEIPRTMAKHRLNLLIVFMIFAVSVWIGAISAQHDPKFVRIILGDRYVDETLERMTHNDPLGVYKGDSQFAMFFQIAVNNSLVALFCILAGLFGWMGVALMQFRNGVMLGAFLYFLGEHGYFHEAMLTVWIHGVIEIFCILVAGAAGMAFGNGLWFPGAWPRGVSFARGAREALRIGVGLIPFFFLAAFFEGFVTRYTEMNDYGRMAIIATTFIFVNYYFVVLPALIVYRKKSEEDSLLKRVFAWTAIGISILLALPGMLIFRPTLRIILGMFRDGDDTFLSTKRFNPNGLSLMVLGWLLIALPALAFGMQLETGILADRSTFQFFILCYLTASYLMVRGLFVLNKEEEVDLKIERKDFGKTEEYERSASTTKI
jgi:uncharacterized membrane protein SpoIIM required for sporulation